MRLLLDHNLPPRLVSTLSLWTWVTRVEHVAERGWSDVDDRTLWQSALAESSLIVTKDKDFGALSAALGFPPKVVLLRFGNCSVEDLRQDLLKREHAVETFAKDPTKGLLVLDRAS
jgi:predicted nuclease of predicted toxin-antitoxin system